MVFLARCLAGFLGALSFACFALAFLAVGNLIWVPTAPPGLAPATAIVFMGGLLFVVGAVALFSWASDRDDQLRRFGPPRRY